MCVFYVLAAATFTDTHVGLKGSDDFAEM